MWWRVKIFLLSKSCYYSVDKWSHTSGWEVKWNHCSEPPLLSPSQLNYLPQFPLLFDYYNFFLNFGRLWLTFLDDRDFQTQILSVFPWLAPWEGQEGWIQHLWVSSSSLWGVLQNCAILKCINTDQVLFFGKVCVGKKVWNKISPIFRKSLFNRNCTLSFTMEVSWGGALGHKVLIIHLVGSLQWNVFLINSKTLSLSLFFSSHILPLSKPTF